MNVYFEKNVVCLHVFIEKNISMKNISWFCVLLFVTCSSLMFSCNRNTESYGACKYEVLQDSVMDVDYNLYSQVKIGTQTWLGENARAIHFADGTPIDNTDTILGARYVFPANHPDSAKKFGVLYNWAAARHIKDTMVKNNLVQGVCPNGYHLPTDEEWTVLVKYVSNCTSNKARTSVAKSLASKDSSWRLSTVPNTPGYALDSNNVSFFAAMPAGHCFLDEVNGTARYYNFCSGANFWSATPYNYTEGDRTLVNPNAYGRYIGYNDVLANKTISNKKACMSIRCVKD